MTFWKKKLERLKDKLRLVKRISPPLFLINFLFGRVFRLNSKCPFNIHFTSKAIFPHQISYTNDLVTLTSFAVSGHCYFQALNGIQIGENFLFAPGVKLISANHDFDNRRKSQSGPGILIGKNVWIGANAVILPGVVIGDNCIVGAGSVVTKSFPMADSILGGVPAKIIGQRAVKSGPSEA